MAFDNVIRILWNAVFALMLGVLTLAAAFFVVVGLLGILVWMFI